jgi:hypothetical protein
METNLGRLIYSLRNKAKHVYKPDEENFRKQFGNQLKAMHCPLCVAKKPCADSSADKTRMLIDELKKKLRNTLNFHCVCGHDLSQEAATLFAEKRPRPQLDCPHCSETICLACYRQDGCRHSEEGYDIRLDFEKAMKHLDAVSPEQLIVLIQAWLVCDTFLSGLKEEKRILLARELAESTMFPLAQTLDESLRLMSSSLGFSVLNLKRWSLAFKGDTNQELIAALGEELGIEINRK